MKRLAAILMICVLAAGTAMSGVTSIFAQSDYARPDEVNTISAQGNNAAAVKADGTLWVWGDGRTGTLGTGVYNAGNRIAYLDDGTVIAAYQSIPMQLLDGVKSVCVNTGTSYAIKEDGSLWAWGLSEGGPKTPYKIAEDVIAVSRNPKDIAIIKSDHSLWMKGSNVDGRFGGFEPFSGETSEFVKCMENVSVFSYDNNMYVFAGAYLEAVVKTDGSLWAWGIDIPHCIRELPEGYSLEEAVTPMKIMDGVRSVACGPKCLFIIKTDNSLWSVGDSNGSGQLGTGSTEVPAAPVKILDDVRQVCVDQRTVAAVKNDGSLWIWGEVPETQLENGLTLKGNYLKPTKVMDRVVSVAVTSKSVFVLKTDGTLWAWGSNYFGQLGNDSYGNVDMLNDVKKDEDIPIYHAKTFHPNPSLIMGNVKLTSIEAASAVPETPIPQSESGWNVFSDVPANAWYIKFLQKAYDSNIIAGTSATTYDPNGSLTHGQIMVMAANLRNTQNGGTYDFQANKKTGDAWYQVFEDYCKEQGIIDDRFDGKEGVKVTRAEMAYYFAHTLDAASYKDKQDISFSDVSGNAYESEIMTLAKADIVGGMGGGLYSPDSLVNRAQASVFISNILDAME